MRGFGELPLELVRQICVLYVTELIEAPEDDKNPKRWPGDLRTICRQFDNAMQPLIFENIVFNFNASRVYKAEAQLKDLAGLCPAHLVARHLHIHSLDHPPFYAVDADDKLEDDDVHHTGELDTLLTLSCGGEYLAKAIRNLKKLRSLVWYVRDGDPVLLVMDALLSLDSLTSISIKYEDFPISGFPTFPFSNLAHFSLSIGRLNNPCALVGWNAWAEGMGFLIRQLKGLMLRSPNIARLSVIRNDQSWLPATTSLPAGFLESATQLESLKLRGFKTSRTDPIMIHRLRKLSSLNISLCSESSSTILWNELLGENVHLRVLKCRVVTRALVNYMKSYSGIEKLSLELAEYFVGDNKNDEEGEREPRVVPPGIPGPITTPNGYLAEDFGLILQKHQDTLVDLSIRVPYGGPWCATNKWAHALLTCAKLVNLGVTFPSERLCDFSQGNDTTIGIVHVKDIITTCSTHLRALQLLRIFFSCPPRSCRDRDRRRRVSWKIGEMIARTICELEIANPADYAFQIRVDKTVFEVQKDDKGLYRYCARRLDPRPFSSRSDSESDDY